MPLPPPSSPLPLSHHLLSLPNGARTLLYRNELGQQGILNHIEDPERRAEQWWRERWNSDTPLCVFHGLGLGYHLPHILERAERGTRFLLVESDPWTFSLCLATTDARPVLDHPNVEVLVTESPREASERTHAWLRRLGGPELQLRFMVDPPSLFPKPTFLRDWFEALAAVAPELASFLLRSLLDYYPKPANLGVNWPIIQNRPGIRRLFGRLRGAPIVAVGAGPGLEELLPILRVAQDRVLTVACDTAVAALARAGIRVDIAVAMDSGERNRDHFLRARGVEFLPVFYGGVFPPLLRDYQETAWIASASPFPTAELLELEMHPTRYFSSKGALVLNQTVGSTALDLALKLGGSPVFLAGIDLAYCGGRHHASGTIYDGSDQFSRSQPGVFEVPSVEGGAVATCTAFLISLLGITHQVRLASVPVYNLSRQGAIIEGAMGRSEGLLVLEELTGSASEAPAHRLQSEADLALRELCQPPRERRAGRRASDSVGPDGVGRWRGELAPSTRLSMAQANLEVLAGRWPEPAKALAGRLSILQEGVLERGERCEWSRDEEGYPRMLIMDRNGHTLAETPAVANPWREVREWTSAPSGDRQGLPTVLGVGLGFHLRGFLERPGLNVLWVWEPYLDRLLIGLGASDFKTVFNDPRLHLSVSPSAGEFFVQVSSKMPELLAHNPLRHRPWVLPGFRAWVSREKSEYLETWVHLFQEIHRATPASPQG
ncbi:MAG: DUF115 domain-containing protein [Candidatus Omnitrophica bacterium]|nr:DUF115 domain-containing protein [Candidatus Omnitrophota bacterium]